MTSQEDSLVVEEWRPVVGFEGLYEVSSLSQVRGVDKYYENRVIGHGFHKGQILRQTCGKAKRMLVLFTVNGVAKRMFVDELVASAFTRERKIGEAVLHLDGNPSNSLPENLTWVTAGQLRDMWKDSSGCQPRVLDTLPGEEWRDIPGREGEHKVSSKGRVMIMDKVVNYRGNPSVLHGKIASTHVSRDGYVKVNLVRDKKTTVALLHRLVAQTFLSNDDNLPEVDHVDANRTNNSVENLRWVSKQENVDHMVELGHLRTPETGWQLDERRKGLVGKCKPLIRDDGKYYESITAAARDIGCNLRTLKEHLSGGHHTCCGHTFRYAYA